MKTINFYKQMRVDGGKRTGIEINGETALERFKEGEGAEDAALLWFVDVRCAGDNLPETPEAAREWLLKKTPLFQEGITAVAGELQAGIDFAAPFSREIPQIESGVTVKIFCSAIRRLPAHHIAGALTDLASQWREFINELQVLEPLAR